MAGSSQIKSGHDARESGAVQSWTPAAVLAENDRPMKKVLDSVTLLGHVFATLEKWASNPREK
jgi:hypothetical protein